MKKSILIILSLFTFGYGINDNVGTSVANFLKIQAGGRAAAMAGAFCAQVNDGSALYLNPSGLSHITKTQVFFNRTDWLLDLEHSFAGLVVPMGRWGNLGLSINYLNYGEMEETTELEPNGTGRKFSAGDLALGVSFSKWISDRFTFGATVKYLQESISFSKAVGMAVDVGSQYRTNFSGLTIGMAITNFGTKMRMYGTDQLIDVDAYPDHEGNKEVNGRLETKGWPLPMAFRFGLSLQPIGKDALIKMNGIEGTINLDYFDPRDLNPIYAVGLELKVYDMLYFRTGTEWKFSKYDDALDDSDSLANLEKEFGYEMKPAWGIGITSAAFPYLPYDIRFDYSVSDMGLLDLVKWYTFAISL